MREKAFVVLLINVPAAALDRLAQRVEVPRSYNISQALPIAFGASARLDWLSLQVASEETA